MCDQADECISETAAVTLTPPNGGPELLVIFAVLKEGFKQQSGEELKMKFSRTIQKDLNPLFKVINIFDEFFYKFKVIIRFFVCLKMDFAKILQVSFVKIVPEFPRTASSKLLRRVLRDQIKQELLSLRSRI